MARPRGSPFPGAEAFQRLASSSLVGIKPQCRTSFDHHHPPLPGALGLGDPLPPGPPSLPSLPSGSRGPPGFRLWPCAALRPPAPSSPRGQHWGRAPPSCSHTPPAGQRGGRRLERRSNHPRIVATLGDERKEVEFPSPAPTRGSSPSATTCPATRAPASLVSHCRDGGGKASGGWGTPAPASPLGLTPHPNTREAAGLCPSRGAQACTLLMTRPGVRAREGMSATAAVYKEERDEHALLC